MVAGSGQDSVGVESENRHSIIDPVLAALPQRCPWEQRQGGRMIQRNRLDTLIEHLLNF